jgi:hypothetical protein
MNPDKSASRKQSEKAFSSWREQAYECFRSEPAGNTHWRVGKNGASDDDFRMTFDPAVMANGVSDTDSVERLSYSKPKRLAVLISSTSEQPCIDGPSAQTVPPFSPGK